MTETQTHKEGADFKAPAHEAEDTIERAEVTDIDGLSGLVEELLADQRLAPTVDLGDGRTKSGRSKGDGFSAALEVERDADGNVIRFSFSPGMSRDSQGLGRREQYTWAPGSEGVTRRIQEATDYRYGAPVERTVTNFAEIGERILDTFGNTQGEEEALETDEEKAERVREAVRMLTETAEHALGGNPDVNSYDVGSGTKIEVRTPSGFILAKFTPKEEGKPITFDYSAQVAGGVSSISWEEGGDTVSSAFNGNEPKEMTAGRKLEAMRGSIEKAMERPEVKSEKLSRAKRVKSLASRAVAAARRVVGR